jgi:hypothetical protein
MRVVRGLMVELIVVGLVFFSWSGCSSPSGEGAGPSDADMASDLEELGSDAAQPPDLVTRPTNGPWKVLDPIAAADPQGLFMMIDVERAETLSLGMSGREVSEIEFSFQSQSVDGEVWDHSAVLYLPDRPNPAAPEGAFALLQLGTQGSVEDVSEPGLYRLNYAANLTSLIGIPTVLVAGIPGPIAAGRRPAWAGFAHPSCYGQTVPGLRYVSCMLDIMVGTSDPEADPFRYIAVAWMRALTASVEVARRIPGTNWVNEPPPSLTLSRAVILADAERAVGARMAAGADDRIDGVFAGGADFADIESLIATMDQHWATDFGWISDLGEMNDWLQTAPGVAWSETVDPAKWPDLINAKSFVHAIGSNDPAFPLRHDAAMRAAFPGDSNRVIVHDYESGIGSQFHLDAWWSFVGRVYLGRPWATVAAEVNEERGRVTVRSNLEPELFGANSYAWSPQQHRVNDDQDYRDVVWSPSELGSVVGAWEGEIVSIVDNRAVFVTINEQARIPTIVDEPSELPTTAHWASPVVFLDGP